MSDIKVKVETTNGELIIREGKAQEPLPLKEPNIIKITGDIHSISAFIKDRTNGHSSQHIDKSRAIVTVDKKARTIFLQLDPESYYGATVLAKLEQSDELAEFKINTTARYNRKQLLDLIRFNRLYFEDKNQHAQLVAGLYKLRIKSESEIEQEKDNRGNKRSLHDIKTIDDGGMVKEFTINIPLFKGFNKQLVTVEVCFEVLNGEVSFWLESVGLKEASDAAVDGIFEDELLSCAGFVVINK